MKNNSLQNTKVTLPANCYLTETPFYKIYRYYATDIVKIENDNVGTKITLSTGGYYTKSTRRHIIDLLAREGININIAFKIQKYAVYYKGREIPFNMKDTCEFYA